MFIDDHIVKEYLRGSNVDVYRDEWIYHCFGSETVYTHPDDEHMEWVSRLYDKLTRQISDFRPKNIEIAERLFPGIEKAAEDYTILLVVGFPSPYEAMTLMNGGKDYMIFDLIQFGKRCLRDDFSCRGVLTHELIHICLHGDYPISDDLSYLEKLDYTAFNEGFAHGIPYPEDFSKFIFDDFLEEKFRAAKEKLRLAVKETDPERQAEYLRSADSGNYWEKFAAIAGKLYILKNIDRIEQIYQDGWRGFAGKILASRN